MKSGWSKSFVVGVVRVESHDWLGCWGHHMKSPGFKALGEHQKVGNCTNTTHSSSCSQEGFTLRKAKLLTTRMTLNLAGVCVSFIPSWTTSRERFRLAERTGCGGTCLRCKVALANKSSAFFPGPLSFLRTSSCSAKPGRTAAPGRNGSSNLYVTQLCDHFTEGKSKRQTSVRVMYDLGVVKIIIQ